MNRMFLSKPEVRLIPHAAEGESFIRVGSAPRVSDR